MLAACDGGEKTRNTPGSPPAPEDHIRKAGRTPKDLRLNRVGCGSFGVTLGVGRKLPATREKSSPPPGKDGLWKARGGGATRLRCAQGRGMRDLRHGEGGSPDCARGLLRPTAPEGEKLPSPGCLTERPSCTSWDARPRTTRRRVRRCRHQSRSENGIPRGCGIPPGEPHPIELRGKTASPTRGSALNPRCAGKILRTSCLSPD